MCNQALRTSCLLQYQYKPTDLDFSLHTNLPSQKGFDPSSFEIPELNTFLNLLIHSISCTSLLNEPQPSLNTALFAVAHFPASRFCG